MTSRKHHFDFVDLHGRPIDPFRAPRRPPSPRAAGSAPESQAEPAAPPDPADLETVLDALCLIGARRGKTWVTHFLRALGWRRAGGKGFDGPVVGQALRALAAAGRADEVEGAGFAASADELAARLPGLLQRPQAASYWRAWAWAAGGAVGPPDRALGSIHVLPGEESVALARLVLASGIGVAEFNEAARRTLGAAASYRVLHEALCGAIGPVVLSRMDPGLRLSLLLALDAHLPRGLSEHPELLAIVEQALDEGRLVLPEQARLSIADVRLHRGDIDGMRRALAGVEEVALPPLYEAAALARSGRWAEASAAFAEALKALSKALGLRRGLAPKSLLQWYVLALLAQPAPASWTQARKFCVAESGSRTPSPLSEWGCWAHAAAVRLGDEPLSPAAFEPLTPQWQPFDADRNADRIVLAAWLGHDPAGWNGELLKRTAAELHRTGMPWKADLVRQAALRLKLPVPPAADGAPWPVAWFGSEQEAWRDALAAMAALGAQGPTGSAGVLRWCLSLDDEGRPWNLEVFERQVGARGGARFKPLTLSRLKQSSRLDQRDAAVARCLRAPNWAPRELTLDLQAAAVALVGHPDLVLSDAPEQTVELRESLPTLEVRRERRPGGAEHYRFVLEEGLVSRAPPELRHHFVGDGREAEQERRNALRVVREGPGRARLIRLTPSQRRVAELVGKDWGVPVDAQAELDAALRALAGHFVLHSDAAGGETMQAEPRLRAQLVPRAAALELQLVVRPFGDFGPALTPGAGRARLITLHQGLSLATERDLDTERAHLAAVCEALPFLGEDDGDARWLIEDPEQGLLAVQALGQHAAVAALEWPRGQPLRVTAPPSRSLRLNVRSSRDWFAIDGELALDESRVLGLQQLMELLRGARQGRFVALGDGEYLALTERLRQQLADLEALAVDAKDGLRLPSTAAAWLAEAAEDLDTRGDAAWKRRLKQLDEAAALQPAPPAALQASLRPYQAEGHAWLARLAHAGFGACLADDMGLGKTVQTLALLLGRAGSGAALVVAPTSVCSNWADETARFAPTLRVLDYGSGERASVLQEAAAGDVVVASYALLLRDAEAFAARDWGTLVLDEAQALKNAATKRAQAIGTLQAGFRLALSGTPVENRLSDLWSIMNLLNPGLLGSAARFAERFAGPIERQRDDAARQRLRRLVGPFLLRRTKAQVLADLPARTEIVHRVEPGADERSFLEAARRNALERLARLDPAGGEAAFNVLAELTRLRRAACDPRLTAPELGLVGAKTQEFERLALELVAGRHQALVFSQFTDFLKLLAERLDAAGLRYQVLDGSTPAAARAERVAAFQRGEADLFLISLKAGGFGLNLTAADYVIIADPWWNPAAEDQAMGRAHRIGQQRPVTAYRLVTAGSIEERIVDLHRDKRALADGLLDGQDGSAPLRADELMDLLRG